METVAKSALAVTSLVLVWWLYGGGAALVALMAVVATASAMLDTHKGESNGTLDGS